MKKRNKYTKAIRKSGPRAAKNLAVLNFVQDLESKSIEVMKLYSLFLNYKSAVIRHGWAYAKELKAIRDERELKRRINELKRQKFIEARSIGNYMEMKLSDRAITLGFINQLSKVKNEGVISTVIIFDIPETESYMRRQLRLFLRQVGFKKVQQSVWVRRADVYNILVEFIYQLRADKWVSVLRTNDKVN